MENELNKWAESTDRLPLIIKGARQVGKTYILTQFAKEKFGGLHYVNFEEQSDLRKVFEGDLNPNRILQDLRINMDQVVSNRELIFFDEIQSCPKALASLKYFAEKLPQVHLCVAGSLLGVVLNEESYPVGKVQHLHLTPLKFSEFLLAYDEWLYEILIQVKVNLSVSSFHHEKLLDAFKLYSAAGGMPSAVLATIRNKENKIELFKDLKNVHSNILTSCSSDFAKHAGRTNASHISSVFSNIPSQLSRNLDGSTKRFVFKDVIAKNKSFAQLSSPIDWLIRAGLVYKTKVINRSEYPLEAFSTENIFKLYYFDHGLLARALNLPYEIILSENYGIAKGYFMENIVLAQLIKTELEVPYCWEENKSEVEFIRSYGSSIVPIEVKSSYKTHSKSLSSYIKRYSPKRAVRLSKNSFLPTKQPILDWPVYLSEYVEEILLRE